MSRLLIKVKQIFPTVSRKEITYRKGESLCLDPLFRTISYRFRNIVLIQQALTHRSFFSDEAEGGRTNERLEFLGDAVLGMVVTDELYNKFPYKDEGELTKIKAYLVSRDMLAEKAKEIDLGKYIFLGHGEEISGGRNRKSILSNTYEALLGAIYLDGGLEKVRSFICRHLLKDVDHLISGVFDHNYKSLLLEYIQGKGGNSPEYIVVGEVGPDHKKEFTVEVRVNGKVLGRGRGYNKKSAEQQAAHEAMKKLLSLE